MSFTIWPHTCAPGSRANFFPGPWESHLKVSRWFSSAPPTVGKNCTSVKQVLCLPELPPIACWRNFFFLTSDIKVPSWENQQCVCFTYHKISDYLQLNLASPKRTPCYICKRQVPTWHALGWDDIWLSSGVFLHVFFLGSCLAVMRMLGWT